MTGNRGQRTAAGCGCARGKGNRRREPHSPGGTQRKGAGGIRPRIGRLAPLPHRRRNVPRRVGPVVRPGPCASKGITGLLGQRTREGPGEFPELAPLVWVTVGLDNEAQEDLPDIQPRCHRRREDRVVKELPRPKGALELLRHELRQGRRRGRWLGLWRGQVRQQGSPLGCCQGWRFPADPTSPVQDHRAEAGDLGPRSDQGWRPGSWRRQLMR